MEVPFFTDSETDNFISDLFQTIYVDKSKHEVISWLRDAPSSTVLRISLDTCLANEFISKLKEIFREKSLSKSISIASHSSLEDVVFLNKLTSRKVSPVSRNEVVIVGSMCGASVLRGADVYEPGVLALPSSTQKGDYVAIYADPFSKVLKGSRVENLLNSGKFLKDKIFVGNGIATISRDELFKENFENGSDLPRSGVAVQVTENNSGCPILSDDTLAPIKDLYVMQNLPSILCGWLVDPVPGDRILDMCASPGGKTTHLASILKRKIKTSRVTGGNILACDKSDKKIDQIYQNCERLHVRELVECLVQDGTKIHFEGKFSPHTFDRILLDAPCSALGQRPQFRQPIKLKELKSFPKLQKKLFSSAVTLLKKPGGVLVYSTCTFTLEENEEIVAWALGKYPELQLVDTRPKIGNPGVPVSGLTPDLCNFVQRFGFGDSCDSIGFFVAKFITA